MWIKLEDGRLVNTDLLTHIEINEIDQTATGWGYGIVMSSKSAVLYQLAQKLSNVGQEGKANG